MESIKGIMFKKSSLNSLFEYKKAYRKQKVKNGKNIQGPEI
jgi:hypothetical protein